ncbi:MAG: diguanylate cyclase [Solibacillus sp.]
MIENQQTIMKFKSDVLSLCVTSLKQLNSLDEYFVLFKQHLQQHFGIEKCCFLLVKKGVLKPLSTESENKLSSWAELNAYFETQNIVEVPSLLQENVGFTAFSHMILLQNSEKQPKGVILLQSTIAFKQLVESACVGEFEEVLTETFEFVFENLDARLNEMQYRKLYNMTDLFHSTMDIDLILENVLLTIQHNFPNLQVELILSNDQDRQTRVQIKPFDYLSERPSTIEAFVSGDITTEYAEDLNCQLLNAPIKGRQAIYGILQVRALASHVYLDAQIDFIRMLAQASGNALENAKLYHQSHRLVSDLQLINETSHRLNMNLDINEMLLYLKKQLMKSFQPMELCFMFKNDEEFELTEASTPLFNEPVSQIYIEQVKKHFKGTHDPLFIADFSRLIAEEVEFKSIMAILMLVEERITGFSIVLHKDPYFFSFDSFKLMQSLIHHSSLAIANSILRSKLQEMVDCDHLTKLYARSYSDNYVEQSLKNDDSGMFLLIDIDNFKKVNDTYGHQIGDEVLMQMGALLRQLIGTRGICARWGGEELAVYIPNIQKEEAVLIAQQIVDAAPGATNPKITVSAGLITWTTIARPEFQHIFLQADTALYHAKRNGKNQVILFDDSMQLQI